MLLKSLFKLSIILVFLHVSNGQRSAYCKLSRKNTMCRFRPGSGCRKTLGRSAITKQVKNRILTLHNKLRQKHRSSNMKEMIWNNELAKVAQRWADQCIYDHDKNRSTFKFQGHVGQNVAFTSGSYKMNFDFVIKLWYNEKKIYRYGNRFVFHKKTAHYTQIVWANTYAVGCGYAQYMRNNSPIQLYVCNYGPGGNLPWEPFMYKRGRPCSKCGGKRCSKQYSKLCAP